MGILTNFLKLLKPEPNDFVDVAKHISENYDKLDENAKSNNETLTNLSNDKLDKGTYSGNAGKLKEDIDEKMSKYQTRYDITDYDDLIEDGFYIAGGSAQGVINAPNGDRALVQVWTFTGYVYQKAVSYYNVELQFTRCFKIGTKNTKWEKIVNTTAIVNNLTTTVPEKVLDGRQGPTIVNKINGLAGGYSGTFPLTTAVKEGIYLLPATNKFYVCVKNYSGSSLTAPNANFEELSVFQNRNKLENLCEISRLDGTPVISNNKYALGYEKHIDGRLIYRIKIWTDKNGTIIKFPIPFTDIKSITASSFDNATSPTSPPYQFGFSELTETQVKVHSEIDNNAGYVNIYGFWR